MNVRSNHSTKSLNPYSNNDNSFNNRTVWLPVHRVRETTSWIGWVILCHNRQNSDANGACSHVGKLLNLHLRRNGCIQIEWLSFQELNYMYSKLNSEYSYLEAEASTFRSNYSESNSGCTKLSSEYSRLNSEDSGV